jgi:glycosyltransferase involved in cell wall biosynthesis
VSAAEAGAQLPPLSEVPTVSVLSLAYNHEEFVAESVESVLAQGWPADRFQYVLINDGSTDGTARALDPYRDRMTVIDQENEGYAGAFHKVMSLMTGEVILGCAGDDALKPGRIEQLVRALQDHPTAGMAYSDLEVIDRNGAVIHPSFLEANQITPASGRIRGRLLRGNVIPGAAVALRGCLKPLLHPMPPDAVWEDYWWAWAVSGVADIVHLPVALTRYRAHGNNLTHGLEGEAKRRAAARELPFRRYMLANIRAGEATPAELLHGIVQLWKIVEYAPDGVEQQLPPCADAEAALPLIADGFALLDQGDVAAAALACAHATALRPFDPALRALTIELVGLVEETSVPPRARGVLRSLEARRFVTFALARELVAAPESLRAYANRFAADADATLLIGATPEEQAEQAVADLVAECGVDGPGAPDMVLAVEPKARLRAFADAADAVLLRDVPYGPTAAYGIDDLDSLRLVAERTWSRAPVGDVEEAVG